jgi:hypothetical protein
MDTQLTAEDGRQSLSAHVEAKGLEIREKYGPTIGWKELLRILEDRTCVRYPCELVFDSEPLRTGEFACSLPKGDRPEEGFRIYVHPYFMMQLEKVPWLVLYQLVLVNYGEFASGEDAEIFGASALGLSQEEYYQTICGLADEISPEVAE